ncbi:peptidylprolyl isomerase [Brevundimonas sp.]|uniref:peptidylprolyl isomerase n=1 Tax=Brevundimonas sp. TaxID=1871086 RepID=UPI002AB9D34C|nr:peptidylprolyl isomerase [Brevundimonas sp.]MDZ4363379.1 peptidylprolyl isomerase [Brevundimonas sp.]
MVRYLATTAGLMLTLTCAFPVLAQTEVGYVPPATDAVAVTPQSPAPPPQNGRSPDWRTVAAEDLLVIDTTRGRILVELAPLIAPLHVERIRLLSRAGFYDGLTWHRVIDYFMAQTGDPLGNGDGQSAYPDLKAEFTFRRGPELPFTAVASPAGAVIGFVGSLPVQSQPDSLMPLTGDGKVHGWALYCPGVAGMARDEGNDTANSQFFLMRQPYPSLDKRYTVWGTVVSGLDVVRSLKTGEDASGMVPGERDRMIRVRVAADLPEAERPLVQILNPGSEPFRLLAEQVRAARGADFSICDIPLPVQVVTAMPAT